MGSCNGNIKEFQYPCLSQSPHPNDITLASKHIYYLSIMYGVLCNERHFSEGSIFPNGWLKVQRSIEGSVYQRVASIRGNMVDSQQRNMVEGLL